MAIVDSFSGTKVNPSAEITIVPLSQKIERAYDDASRPKLMCPLE